MPCSKQNVRWPHNWSAVVYQDSENGPEWETYRVTLLSDPSAVHHANNSIMLNLVKIQWPLETKTKLSVLYGGSYNQQIVRRPGGYNSGINVEVGGSWWSSFGLMLYPDGDPVHMSDGRRLLCWLLFYFGNKEMLMNVQAGTNVQ